MRVTSAQDAAARKTGHLNHAAQTGDRSLGGMWAGVVREEGLSEQKMGEITTGTKAVQCYEKLKVISWADNTGQTCSFIRPFVHSFIC